MSDTVRLPNGKVITTSRARALGMLNPDGTFVAGLPKDSAGERLLRTEKRAAEWRKAQGLDVVVISPDGIIVNTPPTVVLKPSNVDATGAAVTDEAILAKIAAETAAIEAARTEALTPAQKRVITMEANKVALAAELAEVNRQADEVALAAEAAELERQGEAEEAAEEDFDGAD